MARGCTNVKTVPRITTWASTIFLRALAQAPSQNNDRGRHRKFVVNRIDFADLVLFEQREESLQRHLGKVLKWIKASCDAELWCTNSREQTRHLDELERVPACSVGYKGSIKVFDLTQVFKMETC
ncbi:hypothetical protein BDZ45DRAFT_416879 [Acephala macrosclerotiorum]|nr:hypothetical protein BDZ45DRAFT_416879 [Acephala macrosclerotiorum]